MREFNVLNLGAGWQSTKIYLCMVRGELPRADVAIFADTQWEPREVYDHLSWLESLNGPRIVRVTAGNLRQDAIDFRFNGRSLDGKRYASIPVFIKNPDGSSGMVRRQCTSEYKINPIEKWIRRELLGLQKGQRIPKDVIVNQWYGISADERSRAAFPGRYSQVVKKCADLFGGTFEVKHKKWHPVRWSRFFYPLLNEIRLPDRSIIEHKFFDHEQQRQEIGEWLKKNYPDRDIPRSACIGCPFHSNDEWRKMRYHRPDQWSDACDFDEAMRQADAQGPSKRKISAGEPYLHKQLVPLRIVNLDNTGTSTVGGCGSIGDGLDGFCGI